MDVEQSCINLVLLHLVVALFALHEGGRDEVHYAVQLRAQHAIASVELGGPVPEIVRNAHLVDDSVGNESAQVGLKALVRPHTLLILRHFAL